MSSKEETGEKLIIRYDTQPAQINAGTGSVCVGEKIFLLC